MALQVAAQTSTLIPYYGLNSVGNNTTLCTHAGCGVTYFNNADGATLLNGLPGVAIRITGVFSTQAGGDYIQIFDGSGVYQLASYSGVGTIDYTGAPGQSLRVKFTSNPSIQSTGLSASVIYLPAPSISYPSSNVNFPVGTAIAPLTPLNVGGAVNDYVQVTTLAGSGIDGFVNGAGASAQFSGPSGITALSNGTVFVADEGNHLIRRISSTGTVTTLAGGGAGTFADGTGSGASFYFPCGVARDNQGNIIVADKGNNRIRRVTPSGIVTTIAGNGSFSFADGLANMASFFSPRGVATDAQGNIYVADANNHRIRRISPSGQVTTLAGSGIPGLVDGFGGSASFNSPASVALGDSGNLYVSDYANHRIRRLSPNGQVTTWAGNEPACTDGPLAMANFFNPGGMVTDAAGNIYVADAANHRIRKIAPNGTVSTVAGNGVPGFANGSGTAATFNTPTDVALDAAGNIYVADAFNHAIRKISPSIAGYTVSPSLPPGLSLNPQTGVISGTPTTVTPPVTYLITATNESGSSYFNLTLSVGMGGPTINSLAPAATLCAGGSLTINFTAFGFSANNVFTAQLSNSAGSFASPTTLGTLSGATGGTITTTLASNTPLGGGYRIRIIATNPATTGAANSTNLSVQAQPTPAQATITPSATQSICPGLIVTLSAPSTAGLSYQWLQNGSPIAGATNNTFNANASGTYSLLVANSSGCSLLSNNVLINPGVNCPTGPTITELNPDSVFCPGGTLAIQFVATNFSAGNVFTAQLSNASGSFATPVILGTLNSSNGGTISTTIPMNQTPGSGYKIRIVASSPVVTGVSNSANLTVNTAPSAAQLAILPTTNISICPGNSATLSVPRTIGFAYQWLNNGNNIFGATDTAFTTGLAGNYAVRVTNGNGCNALTATRTVSLLTPPVATISPNTSQTFTGTPIALQANTGAGLSYQWRVNGQTVAGGSTNSLYSVSAAGVYNVVVTNASVCSATSSNVNILGVISVSGSGTRTYCAGDTVQVGFTTSGYSPGNQFSLRLSNAAGSFTTFQTIGTLTGTTSGTIVGTLPDSLPAGNGYKLRVVASSPATSSGTSQQTLRMRTPFDGSISLCGVATDSVTGKNRLVWNKPASVNIDSFVIYRRSIATSNYDVVGTLAYSALSTWVDNSADPGARASRYYVAARNKCWESPIGQVHRTMHLTINQGRDANTWNLMWNGYEGFAHSTYQIWRGTNPSNMSLLTTTDANAYNSFTDYSAPTGPVYYQVAVADGPICNPTARTTGEGLWIRSNIVANTLPSDGSVTHQLILYPNPAKDLGHVLIVGAGREDEEFELHILDLAGRVLSSQPIRAGIAYPIGEHLAPGVYTVDVRNALTRLTQHWIKQ